MPVDPTSDPYYRLRHSLAHVMAEAVLELFPDAKIAIGPPIEDGFYYDFDLPRPLSTDDLSAIEERMRRIINADHPFTYREVTADEARTLFATQPYKLELIDGLASGQDDNGAARDDGSTDGNGSSSSVISTYRQATFEDLCKGPHLERTSEIDPDAFKLTSVAGAYWRGDENRPMLQRIYGTAWQNKAELDDYLWRQEEARRRDHRKLGKELDLFSISEDIGGGLILWHPKGALIRGIMEEFARKEHLKAGYDWVYTPHVGKAHLWQTSGHLGFYRENMYSGMELEDDTYYVKPMNCPFHIAIYQSHLRSYRDLPIRYAEYGTVYRFERSGVLHGLTRVRGFTQDDAHIFCSPEQIEDEIGRALEFSLHILRSFGLTDFSAYLATRPAKSVGDTADWEAATAALERALIAHAMPYEREDGGGAFYGPKIDLKIRDALGRAWQLSTIQFDFNLPERFAMEYIAEDGQPRRPYMVHRALLGSMERFFGILTEHYGGAFPVWLSPVQAQLIPITDELLPYAHEVAAQLRAAGMRPAVDERKERMQAKIRDAQLQKIPYMLVIGKKEQAAGTVAVRTRGGDDLGAMPLADFIARASDDVAQGV